MTTLRIESPELRRLIGEIAAFCQSLRVSAWATGGFVRDLLIDRAACDIDVTIDGDPLEIGPPLAEALGGRFFSLREERGQVRILLPAGLHIDLMPFRAPGIEADLRERDYTIDAIAVPISDLADGQAEVIDPTGGLADLKSGIMRMTGEQQLLDDPLRMLRGARIATQLTFDIERATAVGIRRNASAVTQAAAERQRDELVRIFSCHRAGAGVRLLDEIGLFSVLLPEMEPARGVAQPANHHAFDVLGHSVATVEALDILLSHEAPNASPQREIWSELWEGLAWCGGLREFLAAELSPGITRAALLKFTGLLHDMAKPQTKTIDKDGRMRFFGHSDRGAETATSLLKRLRFPTRETAMVAAMIGAHLRPLQLGQQGQPKRKAIYKFFRDTKDAGIETLFLAMADHLGSVGPRVSVEGFRAHVGLTAYILHVRYSEEQVISPPQLVDGDDLMSALGLGPGELLGDLLEAVREAQAGGEVETPEQAIELARARLAEIAAGGGA